MRLRLALLAVSTIFVVSACATKSSDPNACVVATEEGNDPDKVEVQGETAFFGAGCITGRFGCKWKEAVFQGEDIVVDGELSDRKGKVASFKNDVFTYHMNESLLAKAIAGSLQEDSKFEWMKDRVVMTTPLKGLAKKLKGSDTSVVNFTFAPTCTKRQTALGIGFLLAGRKR